MATNKSNKKSQLADVSSEGYAKILQQMKAEFAALEEKLVRKYEENKAALDKVEVAVETSVDKLGDEIKAAAKKQAAIESAIEVKTELSRLHENRVKWIDEEKRRLERQTIFVAKQRAITENETKGINTYRSTITRVWFRYSSFLKFREAVEQEHVKALEKLTRLQNAMKCFKDDLAFELKKNKDGDMMFIFKNVNQYDPDEPYFFSLNMDNDKFIVKDCSPDVGDVGQLVEEMNGENDLSRFVCKMRQRFRDIADGTIP